MSCLITCLYAVRQAWPPRRHMRVDPHAKGLHLSVSGRRDGRRRPLDKALGPKKKQVAHKRARRPLHQRRDLRTHPL